MLEHIVPSEVQESISHDDVHKSPISSKCETRDCHWYDEWVHSRLAAAGFDLTKPYKCWGKSGTYGMRYVQD